MMRPFSADTLRTRSKTCAQQLLFVARMIDLHHFVPHRGVSKLLHSHLLVAGVIAVAEVEACNVEPRIYQASQALLRPARRPQRAEDLCFAWRHEAGEDLWTNDGSSAITSGCALVQSPYLSTQSHKVDHQTIEEDTNDHLVGGHKGGIARRHDFLL